MIAQTPPTTPPTIAPVWFASRGSRSVGEGVGGAVVDTSAEVELAAVAKGYDPVYVPVGRSGGLQAVFLLSADHSPEADYRSSNDAIIDYSPNAASSSGEFQMGA
jgi:hypothetical protein